MSDSIDLSSQKDAFHQREAGQEVHLVEENLSRDLYGNGVLGVLDISSDHRLIGHPENMKSLVDLIRLTEGITWLCGKTCLVTRGPWLDRGGPYQKIAELKFFERAVDKRSFDLFFYANNKNDALNAIVSMLTLEDRHHALASVGFFGGSCQFTPQQIKSILGTNSSRKLCFDKMLFSPEQTLSLASAGRRSRLYLQSCTFQDGGRAFLEESLQQEETPRNITFKGTMPMIMTYFQTLLRRSKNIQYLRLENISLLQGECEALANSRLRGLDLVSCILTEAGRIALQNAHSMLAGLRRLVLKDSNLDSLWLHALQGSTIKRLDVNFRRGDGPRQEKFASALRMNNGLHTLQITFAGDRSDRFDVIVRSLDEHPTLQKLKFKKSPWHRHWNTERKVHAKSVANLVKKNEKIRKIRFYEDTYDSACWNEEVAPRLVYNKYRPRFSKLKRRNRPSFLGAALGHCRRTPSLVLTLLKDNAHILASANA